MIRRMIWILAAVVLAAGLGVPAAAARTGSIRVSMDYGEGIVDGGEVALYHVAEPLEGGYRLKESYGGGAIRQEDACSPQLAQWLSEQAGFGGVRRLLDADGCGDFYGLTEGLYLLVQTQAPEGWQRAAAFLVPIPLNGQWEVLSCPKTAELLTESPQTGQHPAPLFAAMGMVLSGLGLYFCLENLRKK